MRKQTIAAWKKCPKCGKLENQVKAGRNSSGSQRCKCKECDIYYIIEPKRHEYPEETRELVSRDKTSKTIQKMVDAAPDAERYCTDGYSGYLDVVYLGKHIYNIHNKNDTFTIEGVNADLRHYIPTLARRSRCFPRKLENLQAVLAVFVQAYNRFGLQKHRYHSLHPGAAVPFSLFDFL